MEVNKANEKARKNYNYNIYLQIVNKHNNDDNVNYELNVEKEYGEVYAVSGDNPASLFNFSGLVVFDKKPGMGYVESSIVPEGGLAIFVGPSVLEVY